MNTHSPLTCTGKMPPDCSGCALNDHLKCRFQKRDLFHFMVRTLGFMLPAGLGLILGRLYWVLSIWVVFMAVFFTIWEIRILCSHCPYYAEQGKALHCIANYGSPKLWKYHPEPMNLAEKIQLLVGFGMFGIFPLVFLFTAKSWIWAGLATAGLLIFFGYLTTRVCTACVNFSCPLNRVPDDIVRAYLQRNPMMKEDWEKSNKPIFRQ